MTCRGAADSGHVTVVPVIASCHRQVYERWCQRTRFACVCVCTARPHAGCMRRPWCGVLGIMMGRPGPSTLAPRDHAASWTEVPSRRGTHPACMHACGRRISIHACHMMWRGGMVPCHTTHPPTGHVVQSGERGLRVFPLGVAVDTLNERAKCEAALVHFVHLGAINWHYTNAS